MVLFNVSSQRINCDLWESEMLRGPFLLHLCWVGVSCWCPHGHQLGGLRVWVSVTAWEIWLSMIHCQLYHCIT